MAPMNNIKDPLPSFEEFENNYNPPKNKPTLHERSRNSLTAVILGIVFVHVFFHGSMIFVRIASGEAFYWFKNPYFLVYLGICAIFGGLKGQKFTRWIYEEISYLKF
jgi:hypothetical protein